MSVMQLRKNTSIQPTSSYKSLLSQCLVIPVIFSLHRAWWIECKSEIQNEHQSVFPLEQEGTRRQDAKRAEILGIHGRPLSHVFYRLQEIALVFFFFVKICVLLCQYSEHWILFLSQLTAHTRAFRLAIVCFPCLLNGKCQVIESSESSILDKAGGTVLKATWNQVTAAASVVKGKRRFYEAQCVVLGRRDGEVKTCPAVVSGLSRGPEQRGW